MCSVTCEDGTQERFPVILQQPQFGGRMVYRTSYLVATVIVLVKNCVCFADFICKLTYLSELLNFGMAYGLILHECVAFWSKSCLEGCNFSDLIPTLYPASY